MTGRFELLFAVVARSPGRAANWREPEFGPALPVIAAPVIGFLLWVGIFAAIL